MKLARFHALVALVVAVLVIGWCVTRSRSVAVDEHAPTAKPEALKPVELAQPEVTTALAARTTVEAAAVESVAPRQESPDDWIVLVIDGTTKEPVAGAEVAWTGKRVMFRDSRQPLVVPDPESFLDQDARWVTTDASGRVRLAPDALPGFVCARHGEAFGSASVLERRETTVQVWIRRVTHVDIQVVDASGQPVAGVPVSLRAADAAQGMEPIWTGITAGDAGLARARHFRGGLARLKPPFELVAGFEFPTRTAATVPVDVEHLPLDPLRLTLPPTGAVEVRVHDASGQPVLPSSVLLNVTVKGEEDFTVTPILRQFNPASVEKGRALFPFVETGLDLSVQAVVNMAFARASGPGPHVNGERVRFDLDAGPAKPLIVGRLVDEAGSAIADADVQYGLSNKGGGVGSSPLRTDPFGRFEFASMWPTETPIDGELSFRPFGRARAAGGVGSIRLNGPFHDGANDLGDIVVRTPAGLVTGRIVDQHDAPLGRALFNVEFAVDGASAWESSADTTARSDETGAFRVVSTSPHSKLRLRVQKPGYVQLHPFEVTSGAGDVKITLMKAGEISGSVIVEPDIPVTDLSVFARALSEPDLKWNQAPRNECVTVRADGTFHLEDVRPLLFDLTVRRPGMKEPLVVVPSLDLRGGGTAKDPRLSGIDLRGRVRNAHDEKKPADAPR